MNISKFRKEFHALRERGFIKTKRRGPTGVGHTLEVELGLQENNIALPDLSFAELKAHRMNSSSMITLFTFNRKVWQMNPLEAVRKYGTLDEKGRQGLYFTMGGTPTSTGLLIRFEKTSVDLRHIDGTLIASWDLEELVKRFNEKFPAMILVTAEVEERADVEYFHYGRVRKMSGLSQYGLGLAIRSDTAVFDIRWPLKVKRNTPGKSRLLVREAEVPRFFREVTDL